MSKKYKIILCLIMFLLFLTGCKNNNEDEERKEKIKEELNYLDVQIVSIANGLNNLTLNNYVITKEEIQMEEKNKEDSKEEQSTTNSKNNITVTSMEPQSIIDSSETNIDWNGIKSKTEYLNETWPVIVIDLTSANVDNNDILSFSNLLNEIIINIKDEKKEEAINNLASLYSLIPKFEKQVNIDNGEQNIKLAKSYLINAYSLLDEENWAEIENNISKLNTVFKDITNNIEYVKNREFKVNRTYVLVKELQNSLVYKDKKLFLVKYVNVMESINTL